MLFAIMADVKGGSFSRVMQKHAGRAKERLLQNLGKADKTTDEIFDEYVNNFNKQQNAVLKLQKEIKNYHHCLKAMQVASQTLMETICDLYEPNWIEYDQIQVKAQILDTQWEEFCFRVNEQVINPLAAYLVQFPEVGTKIAKRGRKLLDYDGCRHHIQHLEQNTKKREEAKILKAKEQLEEAQNLYEIINSELHDELPALYDSRISFLVSNLQCLFIAEAKFHTEGSKLFTQLNDVMEALAAENQKGTYSSRKLDFATNTTSRLSPFDDETISEEQQRSNGESENEITKPKLTSSNEEIQPLNDENKDYEPIEIGAQVNDNTPSTKNSAAEQTTESKYAEEISEAPLETPSELPPGVLYKVKATFKYVAEDVDELSFDTGEIINVIEFDDPDEQEEGWLMGFKDENGKKGLFPANFTRPL